MLNIEDIIRTTPGYAYWLDLHNRYQGCSERQALFFGLENEAQVIGKYNYQLPVFSQHIHLARELDQNHQAVFRKQESQVFEETFFKDGEEVTFISEKIPLFNPDGSLYGLYCVSVDISPFAAANRRRETTTSQLESTLNHIVANMPGHVYWKDLDGVYLGCNNLQAKSLGLNYWHEVVGKTDYELPWGSNASKYQENDQRVIKTGVPETVEEEAILNNSVNYFLSQKTPLINDKNQVYGILGISFNITQRKQAERSLVDAKKQAELANQMKTNFIAGISHDLRTPLNGIYGAIQVLSRNTYLPKQKVFIESIRKSTENLLSLVEDILNYARIESDQVHLNSDVFDMQKLIDDIICVVTAQANEKGVKLIISYCHSVPTHMISDPNAIRRILINLITNAIKFTDAGHVLISVDLVEKQAHSAIIQLTVEDTGIGIPKDKINLIFDKFTRLHSSHSSPYTGTGLGLTIARKLAQRLGGTINVNSQPSGGSTFWCTLPVQFLTNEPSNTNWQQRYPDVKVLVVDDYQVRAKNLVKQLGTQNSQICGSKQVVSMLQQSVVDNDPFSVLLLDDEPNCCSVYELAKQLQQNSAFKQMMWILLTRPKTLPEQEDAKKAGFFKQFTKPLQPTDLVDQLCLAWQQWERSQLQPADGQAAIDTLSILLVEDDIIAQTVTKEMLQDLHCKVDIVSSGAMAIKSANSKHYDAIFMDVGLPDRDGISVANEIMQSKQNQNLRIIALTAHAFDYHRAECLAAGMENFIAKPVAFEDFEKILTCLRKARPQAQAQR